MSIRREFGSTGLSVSPLCLGGNVFGWTCDEQASFAVLDAYVEAGGNFIDTATVYSTWVPGNVGGESEAIIGRWLKARGNRARAWLSPRRWGTRATRTCAPGSTARTSARALRARSLVWALSSVDLYYAHKDDPATPLDDEPWAC